MELIRLNEADLSALMALQQRMAAALPDPRWYYQSTEAQFASDMHAGYMLGAYDHGQLIVMGSLLPGGGDGECQYARDLGHEPTGTMNFCDVMVDPGYRRQGLHSLLLETFRTTALEQGCHAIYATVDPENLPSRRSFEKAGYEALALRPAYDGRPRVYYRLVLQP